MHLLMIVNDVRIEKHCIGYLDFCFSACFVANFIGNCATIVTQTWQDLTLLHPFINPINLDPETLLNCNTRF